MNKKDILKEAEAKGFTNGRFFVSANGTPDCLVMGDLVVKDFKPLDPKNPTEDELKEMENNGDVVSKSGYGIIYNAKEKRWGQVIDVMAYSTSKKGTNFSKVFIPDLLD